MLSFFRWIGLAAILGSIIIPQDGYAWGRRGHAAVASIAALIAAKSENKDWLKDHTFDLGYYSTVPDLIWKQGDGYGRETPEHYLDLDVLKTQMSKENYDKPWPKDRLEFEKANPQVERTTGRVLWRIMEIDGQLAEVSQKLAAKDLEKNQRHELQGRWLILAGLLAHYVGDLAQPLHLTSNYDGQKTGQKGIHEFFETTLVNALYPRLDDFIQEETKRLWPQKKKQLASQGVFELMVELAEDSYRWIPQVLANDKKVGRTNLSQALRANKGLIIRRMAVGSIYMAELLRRHLDWQFDGNQFYFFDPNPAPIDSPKIEKGFFKSLLEDVE